MEVQDYQAVKPRDKITQKMTRDGVVEVNETQQTAERISSREADSDFSQPDSAAAERVIEHLDAAHTRKANKRQSKRAGSYCFAYFHFPLAVYRGRTGNAGTGTLHQKSENAADRLDAAKAAIPKQKKLVRERTFEEATGKAKTRLRFEEQENRYPAAKGKPAVPPRTGSGDFRPQQDTFR